MCWCYASIVGTVSRNMAERWSQEDGRLFTMGFFAKDDQKNSPMSTLGLDLKEYGSSVGNCNLVLVALIQSNMISST